MISETDKREMMICIDYQNRAKAEKEAGGYVKINLGLPYVAVTMSDGSEYFFQGEEAGQLIDEAENAFHGGIDIEDYILASAQGW